MRNSSSLLANIYKADENSFDEVTLDVFRFQSKFCGIYKQYIDYIKVNPNKVDSIYKIPFLPIELFKSHKILTNSSEYELGFESSGTGGDKSTHYIKDISVYKIAILKTFESFFGLTSDYIFLFLLPSYLENKKSSLVYMSDVLLESSNHALGGYFLNDFQKLNNRILEIQSSVDEHKRRIFLFGVTFALLDFAEKFPQNLSDHIILETGGMKGRKKEITKSELHSFLKFKFQTKSIYGEYAMTELLSQAYSKNDGLYQTPPYMKVVIREVNDPFQLLPNNQRGAINIIDLMNINSCSFIATSDYGQTFDKNTFEVLGRIDNSDIRGCSLLYQ
jgi:hypothetical protein